MLCVCVVVAKQKRHYQPMARTAKKAIQASNSVRDTPSAILLALVGVGRDVSGQDSLQGVCFFVRLMVASRREV